MIKPFNFYEDDTKRKVKKRKRRSDKQERELAKRVGGKAQPGSGNQWHSKGDVIDKDFLHECKYTKNKSFSISIDLWNEIDMKAFQMGGKRPAIELILGVGEENLKLIVLSEDDYLELRGL